MRRRIPALRVITSDPRGLWAGAQLMHPTHPGPTGVTDGVPHPVLWAGGRGKGGGELSASPGKARLFAGLRAPGARWLLHVHGAY